MVLPSHLIRHSYAFPLRLSLPSDEDYKTPFLKRLQRWVKVPKYANFCFALSLAALPDILPVRIFR